MKQLILTKLWLSLKSGINLTLVGILFAVFIIEILTRVAPGLMPSAVKLHFHDDTYVLRGLLADDEIGVKYAPGLVNFSVPIIDDTGKWSSYPLSTVSLGYPGIGFKDDGLQGDPFAIVIGDSFTSCVGVKVEDCWVEVLEHQAGRDFANLGVESYGPQEEQRMLTRYGLPLKPKLVLWVFFANDPDDAWRFNMFGHGGITDGVFWQSPIQTWLAAHSSTFMLSVFFWHNRHFIYNLLTDRQTTLTNEQQQIFRRSNLIWWKTITDMTSAQTIESVGLVEKALLAAHQQTTAAGAEFVVVIIPTREQVYYVNTTLQAQLDALSKSLVEFCQENNIKAIDLTPSMRVQAQTMPFMYFKQDLHLNPGGNTLVAELLNQELAKFLIQ